MIDQRLDHLFRHCSAELKEKVYLFDSSEYLYTVLVCDEDAVRLLRDAPSHVTCVEILLRTSGSVLYSNAKLTTRWVRPPPHDLLFKRVYWSASKLEPKEPLKASRSLAYDA
jgi:hypothetical protein